jgi:hypothetical protein
MGAMRKSMFLLPILLSATPALAQPAGQLPKELADPAAVEKLTNRIEALSTAVLNMKVGEVEAAVEGRPATPADRNLTVGDLARRQDPSFDRHLHQKMASVGPALQQGVKALNQALPEIMRDLQDAQRAVDRAAANMPDPNYPRR